MVEAYLDMVGRWHVVMEDSEMKELVAIIERSFNMLPEPSEELRDLFLTTTITYNANKV